MKFCGECGQALKSTSEVPCKVTRRGEPQEEVSTRERRIYHAKAHMIEQTKQKIKSIFYAEQLETQILSDGNDITIQGRKPPNFFRKALGLDVAATVHLEIDGDDLIVTIGAGKWMDKAVGGAVAWFLFWPAILTTGWGIYMQKQLFSRLDNELIGLLS